MTEAESGVSGSVGKGILLAGGSGTRLHPLTRVVSKQLLPVYDKPLVYFPLSTLMLAGIRDVLVVTTPEDREDFQQLLGDGRQLGMNLQYVVQPAPEGIAQALLIGRDFIGTDSVALILGDNIFHGHGLTRLLKLAASQSRGATIFSYRVPDPGRYGVVELDAAGRPVSLVEKPTHPRSRLAVTGLYFYDGRAVEFAERLEPSARGELEITALNRYYLEAGELHVQQLGRGFAWLDAGTFHSLLQAANFVEMVQSRHGLQIACIEEVAYTMGFIDAQQLRLLAEPMTNQYGRYLLDILDSE